MKNQEKSALLPLIRHDLRTNFTPYSSAASEMGKKDDAIYLNANENPYPFSNLEGLDRYDVQQPPALLATMAKAYGARPDQIIATRGSDESIDLLIRMFCESGKDAILSCPPTFGMYGVYGNLQGAKHIQVPLIAKDNSFSLDANKIIATAKNPDNNVKLVFLCCPNSPTGNVFAPSAITEIISALNGHCAVILDEAYIDFSAQDSFINILSDHPNLLILRTLSKVHALAGERVGATIGGDAAFMAFMRGCLAPYPIPKSVSANAIEALRQAEDKQESMINRIIIERQKLVSAFEKADIVRNVFPSETNFLLVEFISYDAAQSFLKTALAAQIILRDISAKPDTENCLRISVGNEADTDKLISLIKGL